jgi:alpha-tubulin suppressor-like RCC1 family protein
MHESLSCTLHRPATTRALFIVLWTALASCGGDASVTAPFAPDTPQDAGHRVVSITSAYLTTCALTDAGTAACWGANTWGEFGNGTGQGSTVPVPGAGGLRLTKLFGSDGGARMCGVDMNAQAFCWGDNLAGELGNGTTDFSQTPLPVAGGHRFAAIATSFHTCALDDTGRAYCWGSKLGGSLGDGSLGSTDLVLTPQPVVGTTQYTTITNGTQFTCALQANGAADCWGAGVGLGSGGQSASTPTPVSGGLRFARISAAEEWVCALTLAGAPYCWGNAGKKSDNFTDDIRTTPEPVPTSLTFREIIAVNGYGACALTQAGEAYCWFGRGTPQLVPGHHAFVGLGSGLAPGVSGNSAAYCAYTPGGAGYCWYWDTALYNGQPVPVLTTPEQLPPMP